KGLRVQPQLDLQSTAIDLSAYHLMRVARSIRGASARRSARQVHLPIWVVPENATPRPRDQRGSDPHVPIDRTTFRGQFTPALPAVPRPEHPLEEPTDPPNLLVEKADPLQHRVVRLSRGYGERPPRLATVHRSSHTKGSIMRFERHEDDVWG